MDIFLRSSQNWTIFRGHFNRVFSEGQCIEWGIFLLLKIQLFFLGV